MIQVNALGDACPIPIVKTKNAIKELNGSGVVQTLVDNEIAVQNLTKMANQKGYAVNFEKLAVNQFAVTMTVGADALGREGAQDRCFVLSQADGSTRKNTVVVISSSKMGEGNDELGAVLMKGFLYALSQQDELPKTILFYNGGAVIPCEESPSLEDLRSLEAQGVEILTCGTCLDYCGMKDKLQVGEVTNMYSIAEKMAQAELIVKP